ncbi:MAG TPA: glycosyltransferase [Acetobacteraceae bacterium]|nr:glycosyltransferase [Acetobacteraceae bacterium]
MGERRRAHPDLDVIVDARALQEPEYAERGIGRLAASLLAHARGAAPELECARLIGLVDRGLPPLSAPLRALFDAERSTADTGAMERTVWFVEPSPMTHDPLFAARLIAHPRVLSAAVVYDFIPLKEPGRYLAGTGARISYHVALAWLAQYRRHLAISRATAEDLARVLQRPGYQACVIGAPLDPVFEGGASAERRHVLVAGGAEARKNVACALRAQARSAMTREVPVVVTGRYPAAETAALAGEFREAGGKIEGLRFAGHVADAELARLYREALVLVCPSRAEGFSLPVIEAMAAGTPVIASAIDAHAELIGDRGFLFDPDDEAGLGRLIERVCRERGFAEEIVSSQEREWRRFRAAEVARRFWGALAARAGGVSAPSVVAGRRPRVALLTPLPPDRSGCADYSAACTEELGKRVELHLFSATRAPAPRAGAASIRPLSALASVSAGFDRVVGVMGNSPFHLGISSILLRHGGAAICHDARMLGFYGLFVGMERAREVASAELGRNVGAQEIEGWLDCEETLPTLFLGELAGACEPLMFHSREAARLAAAQYGIAENLLPFALYRTWRAEALAAPAREAARARLGVAADEILLASFGMVHPTKLPEECVWALEMLRGWGVAARLCFVGHGVEGCPGLRPLVDRLGLQDAVRFLEDYVSEEIFRDFLLAADVGIQLRSFGFGSVSGALADCIAAGLPSVANEGLAEAIEAPSYVRRIPDRVSPVLLANAIADLIDAGAHRARATAEWRDYAAAHDLAHYAERLSTLLGLEPCG